jgi:hypothetical protein
MSYNSTVRSDHVLSMPSSNTDSFCGP